MGHMAENTDNPAAALPEKIGPWRVVRLVGRGGMADVYEVEDARLGARYALKLFTYARGQVAAARERFVSEGRLLAKLEHPRLVRVYDVGEDEATGCPYFVMQLVVAPDGVPRTLADLETPDEEQVAAWYEDLREGLAYIHGKGILHRDLKLQNVLVGPDGHVVISDFGVAKIADPDLRADLGLSVEQTLIAVRGGQKTVMGSVGYMAPEVEMGVAASKESDWYALGVLVFRLLTGVWCDARTDVVGDLEGYNPTWADVLPKLLHLNPAGRSCPSWRERDRARREEEAFESERQLEEVRDKLRRAKSAKKILVPLCIAVFFALAACAGFALRFRASAAAASVPSFGQIFMVPANAPINEGVSPSEEQFRRAQLDAWAFLGDEFDALEKGECGVLDLAGKMVAVAERTAAGEVDDEVESGIPSYIRTGEDDLLVLLLYRGAERLYRMGGMPAEADRAAAAAEKILARRREEYL